MHRPSSHLMRSGQMVCADCHTERRRSFLWEHAPVAEDCTTCHRPHGSNHRDLLTARTPQLCQQCHLAEFHPSNFEFGAGLPPQGGSSNLVGSEYLGTLPDVQTHVPGTIGEEDFENHPLLRKYYLADRDRDQLRLRTDWLPTHVFSTGINFIYNRDDYQLSEQSALRLSLEHERYRSVDYALDEIAPNTAANVLTLGHLFWNRGGLGWTAIVVGAAPYCPARIFVLRW